MEAHGRGEWQEDQQNQRGMKLQEAQMSRHQPPPPQRCPRCDSDSTKFCYFNNYSLSQPRYFCKACRRYWTQGGTLRNVPVGGGCRKNKRSKAPSSSSSSGGERARTQPLIPALPPPPTLPQQNFTGMAGGVSGNSGILPGNQSVRALPSMGPFYSEGEFLSTLASSRSLNQQPSINQVPVNLDGGHYFGGGTNLALLQGLNLPAGQIQPQNETLASQQYVIPQRPLSSWTPNFVSNSTAGTTNNSGRMGSSINRNQWPDNFPGYPPK